MAKIIIDGIEIKKIAVVVDGFTGNTSGSTSGDTIPSGDTTPIDNWLIFEWDTTQINEVYYHLNNQVFYATESPVRVNVTEKVGTLTQFAFMPNDYHSQYVTKIVQLPDMSNVTDLNGAFMQMTGLEDRYIDLSNQDLSKVTTFQDCFLLMGAHEGEGYTFDFTNTKLPDLDQIKTFQMFAGCNSYNDTVSKVIMNGQTLEDTVKMEELFVVQNAGGNNVVINTGFTPNEAHEERSEEQYTILGDNYTLANRNEFRKITGLHSDWTETYYLPWGNVTTLSFGGSASPEQFTHSYVYDEAETGRRNVTVYVDVYGKNVEAFTYTQVADGETTPIITWYQLSFDTPKDQPIRLLKVNLNIKSEEDYSYYAAFSDTPNYNDSWIHAQNYGISTNSSDYYNAGKSYMFVYPHSYPNGEYDIQTVVFSKDVYWSGLEEYALVDAIQYAIIEEN